MPLDPSHIGLLLLLLGSLGFLIRSLRILATKKSNTTNGAPGGAKKPPPVPASAKKNGGDVDLIVWPPPHPRVDYGYLETVGWQDENIAQNCFSGGDCDAPHNCDIEGCWDSTGKPIPDRKCTCYCMQHCGNTKRYYNCFRARYGPEPCGYTYD